MARKTEIHKPISGFDKFIALVALLISGATLLILYKQLNEQRTDERAWVGTKEVTLVPNGVLCVFSDFGKTPAIHLHGVIWTADREDQIPSFDNPNAPQIENGAVLPPRDSILTPGLVANLIVVIPTPILQQVTAKQRSIFVYGTIWYQDIYKANHWIQFCVEMGHRDLAGSEGRMCARHNMIDD